MSTLSEMLRSRQSELGLSWRALEARHGFTRDKLWRFAKGGYDRLPSPVMIERMASLLGVRPVVVLLAAAEELGLYAPAKDGRLRTGGRRESLPVGVADALDELELALIRER